MLEDLTMIATMPVDEAAVKKAKDEGEKEAAADETGRGQEPSEPEPESEIPELACDED